VFNVHYATIGARRQFSMLLRAFAQNPRRLSQGPTKLQRSFQKGLALGVADLGHVRTRVLGSVFQGLLQFLRVMAWIILVVLHTIGHLAPPEEQE
jgi:hypothetical protein